MDNGWSIVLSSDDLAFIQKVHRYYDMYHDMKAEWSYALCCLKEHHLKDLHNFQPFTSSDDSSLFSMVALLVSIVLATTLNHIAA